MTLLHFSQQPPTSSQYPKSAVRHRKSAKTQTFYAIVSSWLDNYHERTRANHLTALRSLRTFCNGTDPLLPAITADFIDRYAQWLALRGVVPNTAACYLRSLRALYHRAVHEGLVTDDRPFDQCDTRNHVTPKRALTLNEIHQIATVPLADDSPLHGVRDAFFFSILAMGIPFVDLVRLRRRNLHGRHLVYNRRKTSVAVIVKLEKPMLNILQRWHRNDSPLLFPQLSEGLDLNVETDYRHALEHYNRRLRQLGRMAGISEPLTSYRARHSWASLAYNEGIDIGTIAAGLGHTNPRTTRIYIAGGINKKLEKANNIIIKKLGAHLYEIGVRPVEFGCKVT